MSIMQRLYDSGINVSVSSFWDDGFYVKLGDEMTAIGLRDAATHGGMSRSGFTPWSPSLSPQRLCGRSC